MTQLMSGNTQMRVYGKCIHSVVFSSEVFSRINVTDPSVVTHMVDRVNRR